MVERKAERSVVLQIESQMGEFNSLVKDTIYVKLCDQLERMKMILNTKVTHQQLEDCILKATGNPVCVDVAEDSDGSQMNKLELLNEKVHAMA